MITWGIVGNSHDASIAVFEADHTSHGLGAPSTKLLWAGLAKDFSGVANDPHLNEQIIQKAREYGNPDKIVWYERPILKSIRQLWAGQGWLFNENNIKKYLENYGITKVSISYTQHHLSHAAYAYYTQPHDDCAVICLDSIGEFETLTIWHGKNNTLKKIHSQGYPHSLGLFYSAMTQRVGLQAQRDEYLISDWATRGDRDRYTFAILNELVETKGMGADPFIRMRENMHRGVNWWRPHLTSQQDMYDIAAATQAVFEYCLLNLAAWTKAQTKCKHLALAGGGALNKRAVDLLRPKWDTVHVPKNPGDPGSCAGAVLAKTKSRINIDNKWYK